VQLLQTLFPRVFAAIFPISVQAKDREESEEEGEVPAEGVPINPAVLFPAPSVIFR
jgi:hypothetical protein